MDLNTILSVAVGGFIALIPVLLTNWHQAKEHEKDRQEARRQAKIQVMGKLIERDISAMMDSCDNSIRAVREMRAEVASLRDIEEKILKGELPDQAKTDVRAIYEKKLEEIFSKMRDAHAVGLGRLYSFGDEVVTVYYAFEAVLVKIQDFYMGKNNEDIIRLWPEMYARRGELQQLLRNKIAENWIMSDGTKRE